MFITVETFEDFAPGPRPLETLPPGLLPSIGAQTESRRLQTPGAPWARPLDDHWASRSWRYSVLHSI